MRLRRLFTALPLLLAPCAVHAASARLTVLHTTDLHGALTDWDDATDRPAARGLVRVATLVRQVRAEGGPVLLVDGGDAIQGGGIESAWRDAAPLPADGRHDPMMTAMSRLGYDAMAVGNHEFSFGPAALAAARRDAAFPWLAANVVHADGTPAFQGTRVTMAGGVRVGILGLTTPAVPAMEDSAHWAGLRFLPPVEVAKREVARLRNAERCDVVVVVAHTGLERDRADGPERVGDTPGENWGWRLATEVPGIDVLVLGHTHTVVPQLDAGGTLVTQAGKWGEAVGRVDLELARDGNGARWTVVRKSARMLAVTDTVAADSALAAFAAPWHALAESTLSQPVGHAARTVNSPRGRFADGPAWELIQRAQLQATGADVSLAALPDPAATLPRGVVTARDLLRLYPYDNTLSVVTLTGAELKEALEQSARYFDDYKFEDARPLARRGWPAWNFDAAEGVSYEIDLTRPAGGRIVNLLWHGEPLAADHVLTVAVNSYRANGAGGFDVLARAPRVRTLERGVRALIADYLRSVGTLDGVATANWSVLPDYAATPERALVDRLVRRGVAPKAEVLRLYPDEPARRGDLAYWLARAFGWREKKLSGAFADVPDSLEPWLDGLLKRRVLGAQGTADHIEPFAPASLTTALDWCTAAARYAGYAIGDPDAWRRGLLTGTDLRHAWEQARREPPAVSDGMRPPTGGALALAAATPVSGSGAPRLPLTRVQLLALVANTRFPTVRVLETTDFHGFVFPSKDRRSGRSLGGSVALASWIEKLRAENPEGTVLLDGGDCFQGTMISNLQYGRPVVEQMNALGYSASAIGNHEFDWTADTLERRVYEMQFAALGANMVEKRTGRRPAWVRADTVVTRRGVRIGVFGLCYRNTPAVTLPANVAHLFFEDDSVTAARIVPGLRRDQHAQVVVGVGHVPAESDSLWHAVSGDLPRLARGVKGVDLWLGGHSHNRVQDEIDGVPVMIAGAHGEVVAVSDLVVDPVAGRVVEHPSHLQLTWTDEVPPDSAMAERVKRWNADIAPLAARPVARTPRPITRTTENGGDSGIGDLVADAMREAVNADIALQNSGGLRADLVEGTITKGSIYEVMPFDNTIVVEKLTGSEIRSLFADGRALPQSGLRLSLDPGRPQGQRLVGITRADGRPLDPAATYTVAMNNFMATGGDNLMLFARTPHTDTSVLVRDAIERFITGRARDGVLDFGPDGRIQRVSTPDTHD